MREVKESRELVFGLHDGALVSLGLLSGLTGAALAIPTVLLVGSIHVVSASLSIGLVTYASSKSHAAYKKSVYEFERAEIEEHPAREKERVKEALAKKGLRGKALREATEEVTEEKDHWATFFVEQRFGSAHENKRSPFRAATTIGASYAVAALVVLLPFFVVNQPYAIITSVLFALAVATYAGFIKTRFTHRHPLLSGIESAAVTTSVAVISFFGGSVLARVLGF